MSGRERVLAGVAVVLLVFVLGGLLRPAFDAPKLVARTPEMPVARIDMRRLIELSPPWVEVTQGHFYFHTKKRRAQASVIRADWPVLLRSDALTLPALVLDDTAFWRRPIERAVVVLVVQLADMPSPSEEFALSIRARMEWETERSDRGLPPLPSASVARYSIRDREDPGRWYRRDNEEIWISRVKDYVDARRRLRLALHVDLRAPARWTPAPKGAEMEPLERLRLVLDVSAPR